MASVGAGLHQLN